MQHAPATETNAPEDFAVLGAEAHLALERLELVETMRLELVALVRDERTRPSLFRRRWKRLRS